MKFLDNKEFYKVKKIIDKGQKNIEQKYKDNNYYEPYFEENAKVFNEIISIRGKKLGLHFNGSQFSRCSNIAKEEITKRLKLYSISIKDVRGVIVKVILPSKEFNKDSVISNLCECYNEIEYMLNEYALFFPMSQECKDVKEYELYILFIVPRFKLV